MRSTRELVTSIKRMLSPSELSDEEFSGIDFPAYMKQLIVMQRGFIRMVRKEIPCFWGHPPMRHRKLMDMPSVM